MAFVLKPLEWKRLYEFSQYSQVAELPRGRYVVEYYNGTYRWGFSFDNTDFDDKGFFYCDSLEEGKTLCEANWKSRVTKYMDEVVAYGAPYVATLTATGISTAASGDTIDIVIGGVTYTFTADISGDFDSATFTVAGGTADPNLTFDIDQVANEIVITNSVESFTVTSYTITLAGTPTVVSDPVESVATEI